MAALARQSTAFRDVSNQWLCSGLAVLSVRSSYPPQSCCRGLHADLHKVTTIPYQGKHCLEMSGLFCSLFAILDNRVPVQKKKKVTHFPKDLTPQAYSQMGMKESLLSVGHLDTVSHQRNVEVFVETVSSPEWPSSLLIGLLWWFRIVGPY